MGLWAFAFGVSVYACAFVDWFGCFGSFLVVWGGEEFAA
jgi:hypothetical protein